MSEVPELSFVFVYFQSRCTDNLFTHQPGDGDFECGLQLSSFCWLPSHLCGDNGDDDGGDDDGGDDDGGDDDGGDDDGGDVDVSPNNHMISGPKTNLRWPMFWSGSLCWWRWCVSDEEEGDAWFT